MQMVFVYMALIFQISLNYMSWTLFVYRKHTTQNYNINHSDGTIHGGNAIVIRNSIKHVEMNKYQTGHIKPISASIKERR